MIHAGWNEVDEAVDQASADSDLFIKLKDHGDKCLGVFCPKAKEFLAKTKKPAEEDELLI